MSDKKATELKRKNNTEQNRKVLERALTHSKKVKGGAATYQELRESIQAKTGIDITDEKQFPINQPGFTFAGMEAKLQEANVATSLPQLLRAGVQTAMIGQYVQVPTTFEEWAQVMPSDKEEELYAPLHGLSFVREVGRQEKYPESQILGLDIGLKNRKYGEIFPVEKELLMNDQTGQVQGLVSVMAEYAKLVPEVLAYGKLNSVAGQAYLDLKVPKSETQPASEAAYPWSSSLVGGGSTKLAAGATAFTSTSFQNARKTLRAQKNLLGIKMKVTPNRLIVSPHYELDAATILHSNFYPAGAQAAGVTGGAFAQNFLKGISQLTIADYMFDQTGKITGDSLAWYVLDDTKPAFVVQMRQPGEVIQEASDAGESFERDIIRWKLSVFCNADFIDPRFFLQGSDGSV